MGIADSIRSATATMNQVASLIESAYTEIYCGTSAGSANAQTITGPTGLSAYTSGQSFLFVAGFSNSASGPTLNVSSIGAKTMVGPLQQPLSKGAIVAGQLYLAIYYSSFDQFIVIEQNGRDLLRDPDGGTIVSTAVETTITSTTIKGGVLVTGRAFKYTAFGGIQNTTGGNVKFTWRWKFGGSTIFTHNNRGVAIATGTATAWKLEVLCSSTNSTAQKAVSILTLGHTPAFDPQVSGAMGATTSSDVTMALTGQMDVSSANAKIDTYAQFIELL